MSYPPVTGHAAATESHDMGDRLGEGYEFLRDQGFRGLCSIEYKGDAPERYKFIEVTVGRCDWWIMGCSLNGVDIPMAAYNDLTGCNLPHANQQRQTRIWHDIDHSIPVLLDNLVSGRWSLGRALRFVVSPKQDAVFDLHDPGPFLHSLPGYLLAPAALFWRQIRKRLPG